MQELELFPKRDFIPRVVQGLFRIEKLLTPKADLSWLEAMISLSGSAPSPLFITSSSSRIVRFAKAIDNCSYRKKKEQKNVVCACVAPSRNLCNGSFDTQSNVNPYDKFFFFLGFFLITFAGQDNFFYIVFDSPAIIEPRSCLFLGIFFVKFGGSWYNSALLIH